MKHFGFLRKVIFEYLYAKYDKGFVNMKTIFKFG